MTVKCSDCIHDKVCALKDKLYEIQKLCKEADKKYEEFRVSYNCNYYEDANITWDLEQFS